VLLSDEQITIRDDNYFPSPPTSPSPVPAKSAAGAAAIGTLNGADSANPGTPDAQKDSATSQARAAAEAQAKAEAERAMEEHNQLLINSMSLIEWDLPRTYPTLGELASC
jgi:NaMN:DMB phosphoribosyltransferase